MIKETVLEIPHSALETTISSVIKHAESQPRYIYRDDSFGTFVVTSNVHEQKEQEHYTPVAYVFAKPVDEATFLKNFIEFAQGKFPRAYVPRAHDCVTIYQRSALKKGIEVFDASLVTAKNGSPVVHNMQSKGLLTEAGLRKAATDYPLRFLLQTALEVLSHPPVARYEGKKPLIEEPYKILSFKQI